MARNSRQSKILELISTNEIETQEELVSSLKDANFDVTQATISRDIKELGLIKILTDSKKYKYAVVSSSVQALSNKCLNIFKECVISVKSAMNLTIVKVIKGTAGMVSNLIDQLSMSQILGCTYGDDTVMVITSDQDDAYFVRDKLNSLLN
ncbi:MAG: arginine repressor [Firmicutes bacterium]|nr:arginine repressor [Bacillota bacterium]MDY5676953.1 arginine repressor [Eubacteriales bacterium]